LNLSMLRYFFDIRTKEETKVLFNGLKIENEKEIMKLQGEYPVVFVTFKNEKYLTYEDFKDGIIFLLSNLYREHEYLLNSNELSSIDKDNYINMMAGKASIAELCNGISSLMAYMNKHYGRKTMLFIDEYDVPIQEGYINGYYEQMIILIRNLLTSALKDNPYVEKSLITGILRVAKESIFSGLNNLEVNTLLRYSFNDKFGFTEEEVEKLARYYDSSNEIEGIKEWYNGYIFGGEVIYNPWSVLNYLKNKREGFMPYWINSSSNDLIKKLLLKGDNSLKLELEDLIEGKSISKVIDDTIVMSEVEDSNENIWSFLLMSGYLKAVKTENIEGILNCELKIPNKEVLIFYKILIEKWFKETLNNQKYNIMLKALITKDLEVFEEIFTDFVMKNMSYFDVSGKEPEKVYHAFVLGMIVSLADKYEVKSNKESGYGRYAHLKKCDSTTRNLMLIPRDISKLGIIIEFKRIKDTASKTIDEGGKEALDQIEKNKYEAELQDRGVKNIWKLAIVFKGKRVGIVSGD
ncbi:MAG: hypothetical protein K0R54_5744, partial [Clostridiaceae bacterium]|nr:hypothetical protein [Clostridiaceae bacterium]